MWGKKGEEIKNDPFNRYQATKKKKKKDRPKNPTVTQTLAMFDNSASGSYKEKTKPEVTVVKLPPFLCKI